MKARWWIGVGVVVTLVVVLGLGAGWLWWERSMWHQRAMAAPLTRAGAVDDDCGRGRYGGMGAGMMGSAGDGPEASGCDGPSGITAAACDADGVPADEGDACVAVGGDGRYGDGEVISLDDAQLAVERYVAGWGDANLAIGEMMEFDKNFYAIVEEADSGIGAMELLVDKYTGAVQPEFGPNMMWNARYGMHRRGGMMGRNSAVNTVGEDEAVEIAQQWLNRNRPGVTTEAHADPFYGYYTIHTVADGEIEGMLSVHGTTGQVWYHNWHGNFVQMIEGDEH